MSALSLRKKKAPQQYLVKKPLTYYFRKYWQLYLLMIPGFLYMIFFELWPLHGLLLAFKDYSFKKGIFGSDWVGFRYFKTFFGSYDFWPMVKNTVVIGFIKTILEFPCAIILALLLNELRNLKFKKAVQTISYLPHFMSGVVIVTLAQKVLAPNVGVLNQVIAAFGGDGSTYFLNEKNFFYIILYILDTWEGVGWGSIIYLSALSSVNTELYEAVEIDGGGRWTKMRHVSLPSIIPTAGLLFIMGVGGLFSSSATQLWLLRTPGNSALAETLDYYVLRIGLVGGQYGYATAVGIVQAIVGFILVYIFNTLGKKFTEVSLW